MFRTAKNEKPLILEDLLFNVLDLLIAANYFIISFSLYEYFSENNTIIEKSGKF